MVDQANLKDSKIALHNQETAKLLGIGDRLLTLAKDEDWGPGGWDPKDFESIIKGYREKIQKIKTSEIAEAARRRELAHEMVRSVVQTKTGAWACAEIELCTVETREIGRQQWKPQGSMGRFSGTYDPFWEEVRWTIKSYYYQGDLVKVEKFQQRIPDPLKDMKRELEERRSFFP